MKQVGIVILMMGIVATMFVPTGRVSATTLRSSGQIKVRAEVVATHYITVDQSGQIIQIASNTNEAGTPRVFVGSIDKTHEQAMTTAVLAQYMALVPSGRSRIGIVYNRQSPLSLIGEPVTSSGLALVERNRLHPANALQFNLQTPNLLATRR